MPCLKFVQMLRARQPDQSWILVWSEEVEDMSVPGSGGGSDSDDDKAAGQDVVHLRNLKEMLMPN